MAATATGDLPIETRLEMIRQLAEALDHAHRRHLYHRALAPRSVYVEMDGRYPRLRIADWQVAARPHGTATGTMVLQAGPARGRAHVRRAADPSASTSSCPPARTSRRSSRKTRPPRRCSTSSVSAQLSYLILTGQPPAASRGELASQAHHRARARPVLGRRLGQPRHGRSGPRRHAGLSRPTAPSRSGSSSASSTRSRTS